MYTLNITPGDRLLVKKAFVFNDAVTHSGTYMGRGQVAHLSPGKGLAVEPIGDFLNGQTPEIVSNGSIPENVLWERFREFAKKNPNYQLLNNNCEHLCSFLEMGEAQSMQLRGGVAGFSMGLSTVRALKIENPLFAIALIAFSSYLGAQAGAPKAQWA